MNRHNFQTFKISNRSTPFFLDRESSEVSERVKQKFPGNPVSKILKKKKKKFERISRPQWRAMSPLSLVEAMLTFNLLMEVFLVSPSFFSFLSFFFFSPFTQAQRPCNYRDAALTRVGLDGVLQEHYNALSSSTSVFEAGAKRLAGRIALNDFLFHEALPYFFSPNGIPYRQSLSLQYFCPYRVCVSSVLSLLLKAKISKNFWDYNDILL